MWNTNVLFPCLPIPENLKTARRMFQMSLVCELITWKTVQRLARSLAFKLVDASFIPDIIVAIGRGGCVPARIVADYLQVFRVTSIKIEHYTMGAQRLERDYHITVSREMLHDVLVLMSWHQNHSLDQ
jgi:hypoxanthine phosphoribosyltransferase